MYLLKLLIKMMVLFGLISIWVIYNNDSITKDSSPYIYSDVYKIPSKKGALVLGTSKYLVGGRINYYYKYRIDSAVKLFKSGKVKAIVVSGDNGSKYYDEPTTMYEDLISRGIPAKYITIDYAGFRTLDSIVRAEKVFGLEDYIIVSQRFHLERAIYLAHAKGQKVLGFVAKDFRDTFWAKRMEYRELLARAKAFFDIHLGVEPKFLGKKEEIEYK